jgi:hypothetical protein
MKKNPSVNRESNKEFGHYEQEGSFIRKGKVGDWRNYFSEEASREFDRLIAANLKYSRGFNYGEH